MIKAWIGVGLVLVACIVAALGGVLPSYYVGLITEALIIALFVMSLDLLAGFTGLESLGHAAFFGIGAYVSALLSLNGVDNMFVLIGAAMLVATITGAAFGAVALRAIGPYFLIITMALGYLPWALAIRWRGLTGGDDGLPGIMRPTLGFGISVDSVTNFFIFVVAVFAVCAVVLAIVGRSAFGRTLKGIKDNPSRMDALGYRIWLHKYVCFIIASAFAGIAGALFGFYNGFVSPMDLSVYRSAEALVAVILGGAGTLIGPAIGAVAILVLRFTVSAWTEYWGFVLGAIYILVVLFAPQGVFAAFGRAANKPKVTK
ncbi:MAG: branched-chain amino acid ABC transporter permease [Alphaproteobacteria bacterium]